MKIEMLHEDLEKLVNQNNNIKKINDSFYLDIASLVPAFYPYTKGKFFIEKIKDKVKIFYKNVGHVSPTPIVVPKYIPLGENFFENIGLYIAEGQTSMQTNSKKLTKFSNSDSELINSFLNFLESFGIQKEVLIAEIQVHEYSKFSEDKIRSNWNDKVGLPKGKLHIRWAKSQSKNKSKKLSKRFKPYGTLHVLFDSTVFKFLLMKIIEFVRKIAEEHPSVSIFILRGISAGEGGVQVNPGTGSLNRVSISAVKPENRKFIKKLLTNIGIEKTLENTTDIFIYNYFNFIKLDNIGIFALCSSKKKLFKNTFYKLKKSKGGVPGKTQDNILKLLKHSNRLMSGKSIAWYLRFGYKGIMCELHKLEKRGLVERIKRNTIRRNETNYLWKIVNKE